VIETPFALVMRHGLVAREENYLERKVSVMSSVATIITDGPGRLGNSHKAGNSSQPAALPLHGAAAP
jgi:hypothetical protein